MSCSPLFNLFSSSSLLFSYFLKREIKVKKERKGGKKVIFSLCFQKVVLFSPFGQRARSDFRKLNESQHTLVEQRSAITTTLAEPAPGPDFVITNPNLETCINAPDTGQ